MECGEGKVWFRVGDSPDFSVSQRGVVYTQRPLNLEEEEEKKKAQVVVYAQDLQSKQLWKLRVHLHVRANSTAPHQVCIYTRHV